MTLKEIIEKQKRNGGDYIPDYRYPALQFDLEKLIEYAVKEGYSGGMVYGVNQFGGYIDEEMETGRENFWQKNKSKFLGE